MDARETAYLERRIVAHDLTEIKQRNGVEGITECKAVCLEIVAEVNLRNAQRGQGQIGYSD